MAASPIFVGSMNNGLVQILPADASNQKALVTAGASGAKVTAIMVCSDDTSARVLQLSILRSAVSYVIGSVNIPTLSGTDGTTAAVDLLNATLLPGLSVDNDGEKYLLLNASDVLQVKSLTTVTAAKTIHVTTTAGNF